MDQQELADGCVYVSLSSYDWRRVSSRYVPGCGRTLAVNITVYCIFAAASAVSITLSLGLIIGVLWTFNRRNTLYFWSLISTCAGIILMAIGFDMPMWANTRGHMGYVYLTIIYVGWILMISGFSLTLYSRVHLILFNQRALRLLLLMIIVDGVIVFVPSIVLGYIPPTPNRRKADKAYSRMDIIFAAQETFLTSLYTWLFTRFIRPESVRHTTNKRIKTTFWGLVAGQVVVLSCDITIMTLIFADLHLACRLVRPLGYAIKVLVEFLVLNQLVKFSSTCSGTLQLPTLSDHTKDGSLSAVEQGPRISRLSSDDTIVGSISIP